MLVSHRSVQLQYMVPLGQTGTQRAFWHVLPKAAQFEQTCPVDPHALAEFPGTQLPALQQPVRHACVESQGTVTEVAAPIGNE